MLLKCNSYGFCQVIREVSGSIPSPVTLSAMCLSLSLLVFYVTCDDISVIYVTAQMCRRTEEEVEVVPTVGLPTP